MEGLPETVEDDGSTDRASSGTSVSDNDLFITATANKTNLYEQEALLLT